MDRGLSRPGATFANPCLSHDQAFDVAAVEVWALAPPPADAEPAAAGGLVMDRAAQASAFMDLAGVTKGHSAGLRAERPEPEGGGCGGGR
jgi:hypothetical protein